MCLSTSLLMSCSDEKPETDSRAAGAQEWIEFQIVLRSKPYKSSDEINGGDFEIIRSLLIPVASEGGAGYSSSLSDGTLVEIKWDRVAPLPRTQKGILLEGFSWIIRNDLFVNSNRRTFGWNGSSKRVFTEDFDFLTSTISLSHTRGEKAPDLIIRARLTRRAPKVADIRLTG